MTETLRDLELLVTIAAVDFAPHEKFVSIAKLRRRTDCCWHAYAYTRAGSIASPSKRLQWRSYKCTPTNQAMLLTWCFQNGYVSQADSRNHAVARESHQMAPARIVM